MSVVQIKEDFIGCNCVMIKEKDSPEAQEICIFLSRFTHITLS